MKPLLPLLLCAVAAPVAHAGPVRVRSYTTKTGSYHSPSTRTSPDRTQRNNYGSKGNVNPYTGKSGTRKVTK